MIRLRRSDVLLYSAAAVLSAVLVIITLQLWRANLSVPFTYRGDALPVGAHFKTVIEEGWYEHQPRLGAPFGQHYSDFPTADNLHLIAAKFLSLFTSDWGTAMNVYYIAGFILTALTAVWFLRVCTISRSLSLVLAVLYSLAPYHFIRGESHLWLASYYTVPLALGLSVLLFQRRPLWGWGESRHRMVRIIMSPTMRSVVFLALLGTSSSYYSIFFLVLLAMSGIAVLIRDRNWRVFWGAAGAGLLTVAVMIINMLPDFLYQQEHGQNLSGLERSRAETEFYSLKLVQLLLPWPGHRLEPLAALRAQYDSFYLAVGEQPALGVIGAVGLVAAFVLIVILIVARTKIPSEHRTGGSWSLLGNLSILVFIAFLFSTLGGLSTVISFATSSLRGWNRMSILIALLCLAIVGLLLDLARRRWGSGHGPRTQRTVAALLAVVLLGVGFYDQTPGNAGDEYASNEAAYTADAEYFSTIQASLPTGAMVLVLPYIPFPESSAATGLLASDQLIPYLHTSTVRWSNAGIKGRPTTDWPGQLAMYPTDLTAVLASAAGSDGILVDRAGLADSGRELEAAIVKASGASAFTSPNGRFAYFDIASFRAEQDASRSTVDRAELLALITKPVMLTFPPDFNAALDENGLTVAQSNDANPRLALVNVRSSAVEVTISMVVTSSVTQGRTTITLPDGSVLSEDYTGSTAAFTVALAAKPGDHPITVQVTDLNGTPVSKTVLGEIHLEQDVVLKLASNRG
ncbi:hypothetical protein E3T43_11115 [Cryobacterium sp. Hh7]|uniref:hypothetical protein n=1 Tax=Cryobacterium sp. Hh7 TaxID=1259159 RepID=UPI00106BCCDD|nr:hypothetical protein [Cryobacterium sp. Hh7]TFD55478.1 hypothetical protein E3T43_11115 [Cryobacterium sp. Hh7]